MTSAESMHAANGIGDELDQLKYEEGLGELRGSSELPNADDLLDGLEEDDKAVDEDDDDYTRDYANDRDDDEKDADDDEDEEGTL
jgi:hypothetical protein